MDREQELEVVTTAYFLEDRIRELKKENAVLSNSRPPKPIAPREPKEEHLKAELKPYPSITPPKVQLAPFWKRGIRMWILNFAIQIIAYIITFKFPGFGQLLGTLGGLIGAAGTIVLISDGFKASKKRKQAIQKQIEEIKNSSEYKNECKIIDEWNQNQQAELDRNCHERYLKRYEEYKAACQEHQIRLKEYEEEVLPSWKHEVSDLTNVIENTNKVLQEVYDKKVIPIQYCNISALCYLTMFLSTSNYDLKYAIERYDMYVTQIMQREHIEISRAQLELGREALENQQYANWLNEQIAELSREGNHTLKSISNWQKADFALREYRRYKARKEAKKK